MGVITDQGTTVSRELIRELIEDAREEKAAFAFVMGLFAFMMICLIGNIVYIALTGDFTVIIIAAISAAASRIYTRIRQGGHSA